MTHLQQSPPARLAHGSWSTASELEFIERLARSNDPLVNLRGYIAGLAKRTRLGQLDFNEVTRFANAKLAQVRGVAP
ncbi:hypothetical protein AB3X91_11915 [Paraburkholderia sp. BR14263]|uniref:hypothetical protein n=1 Tax=unclassified Paraburkholderia TaxID=2615204 RepID=UPI0034CE3BF9